MLPARHRLRTSTAFRRTVTFGRKGAGRYVVAHVLAGEPTQEIQIGFVVSKAVGNAVVRHRVTRRLRAVATERIAELPAGAALVVRALPSAADATSTQLDADLARALERASS